MTYIPPIVQQMIDDLAQDTGVTPSVRKHLAGYLLEHENEHVRMTIYYKQRGGKWAWAGSRLFLDGVQQKLLAHGYEDYVEIFKRGRRGGLTQGRELAKELGLGEEIPQADVPAEMRTICTKIIGGITDKSVRKNISLSVHQQGENEYMLVIRLMKITSYHSFELRSGGSHIIPSNVLVVFEDEDGRWDITQRFMELHGDMDHLLAEMTGTNPVAEVPRQVHHTAEPKRLNSVEVRRASVIRV